MSAGPPVLLVRQPGQFATVQDGGRLGWRRYGVSRGGAVDQASLAVANVLVGNRADAAAVEFMFVGGEYEFRAESGRVAVAGGDFSILLNGERVSACRSVRLARGDTLRIGSCSGATWGYIALAGGFALPRELGSASTHVRSGLGGLHGGALQAGDALPLACEHDRRRTSPDRVHYARTRRPDAPIRVVLGPQQDRFTPEAIETLLSAPFAVTHRIDRMGCQLGGPLLRHRDGFNIISDAILAGSIQVPGSGQPIVLLAECQTTGGYPKIATVISADLGRLAQRRAGGTLRFQAISPHQAHGAYLGFHRWIDTLPRQIQDFAEGNGPMALLPAALSGSRPAQRDRLAERESL